MCSPKNYLTPMTVSTITFDSFCCGFFPKLNGSPFIRDWQTSANGKNKWFKGCDYYGNDLLPSSIQFNISDYATCAEYCQSHPLCTFFTFNKLRSICFPKASTDYFTDYNNTEGAVCGFIARKQFNIIPSIAAAAVIEAVTTAKITSSAPNSTVETKKKAKTDAPEIDYDWFPVD